MYHYLYKITNTINNKIYIGVHKTNDLNDGYMGSGKIIVSAIEKHGEQNFKKEIIQFFDTYEQALEKEKEVVNDEFLLREDVYNIRRGGLGGFDYINKNGLWALRDGESNSFYGKKHTVETKKLLAENASKQWKGVEKSNEHKRNISNALKGKKFTDERRKNISNACKGRIPSNKGIVNEKIICEHCGKSVGGQGNYKRWHGDNCKMKEKI